MRWWNSALLSLTTPLVVFNGACAPARRVNAPSPPHDVLRLRAGDAVRLAIKDEPALAGEFPVTPDGTVLLPLIGLVPVAAEPFDRVAAEVRRRYEQEFTDAVVVLMPLMRVAVTGEVRAPGIFVVDPTFTWSDILSRVGGALPSAARDRMMLVRDGHEYELRRSGEASWPSFPVRSGDRLTIPRRAWAEENLPLLIGSATSVLVATVTALILR